MTITRFPTLQLIIAALLFGPVLSMSTPAGAQGMTARGATTAINPDIVKLQRQLAALEKRIVELEKEDIENVDDPDEADRQAARDKALERRLAALERSAAEGKPSKDQTGSSEGDGEDSITVRAPFVVHDKAGRTIFRIDAVDGDRPIMVVGNGLAASAVLGIDTLGNASLRLFDAQRQAAAVISARSEGGNLFLSNKSNKDAVTLSVDQSGAGRVKVFNNTGRAVTGLSSDGSGGRVLVVDGKSGLNAVTLSTSTEGGMVNVYAPQGGSPRASMVADGKSGSVNVFNDNGVAAGVIEAGKAGSGRLVLANAAGDIVVEAGVLPKGIGIVRAGPGGSGPAGVVGGTVQPASSIQGRK